MRILCTGAGGFIGSHLVRKLKSLGHWVRGVDLKHPQWSQSEADEFWLLDLRDADYAGVACRGVERIYHLAADMGGAGFVFVGDKDKEIAFNNSRINSNVLMAAWRAGVKRLLFSSSACVYPERLQLGEPYNLKESDAYPAGPDSEYGWEKLWMERLCKIMEKATDLEVRITRFHNCYGPEGAWNDGREKAPAAMCRKVATAKLTGNPQVEIWGDGQQVRSFMYISDCVNGLIRLMESDYNEPLNIGRDRAVTIDYLVDVAAGIAGIEVEKAHIPGPEGVRYRNSDNSLCREVLVWEPTVPLGIGLVSTYKWIENRVREVGYD